VKVIWFRQVVFTLFPARLHDCRLSGNFIHPFQSFQNPFQAPNACTAHKLLCLFHKHLFALLVDNMIWALLYLILLFIMISSALLAGMRRDEADFFALKPESPDKRGEVEKIKASM